uniref:Uncharacterized protein n=1 Tax=Anopheles melas TaxID=34690 RepID=A0A182TS14_9DIPT
MPKTNHHRIGYTDRYQFTIATLSCAMSTGVNIHLRRPIELMKRILSYGWGTYRISNGKVTEQSLNWSPRRFVGIGAGDGANGDGTDPTVPPGDSKIDLLLFPFPTVPSAAVVMHEVQRHRAIPRYPDGPGEGVFCQPSQS